MDPLTIGLIGSALIGGGAAIFGSQNANNANRDIANAQMAFQANQANMNADQSWDMFHQTQAFNREEGIWARNFNFDAARRQEDFQRETLASAQDYNTRMSNTSWQRGVADMKAAGINPILAYSRGGATAPTIGGASGAGASSPMASSPGGSPRPAMSGASARMENVLSGIASTAMQAARGAQEIEATAAQIDKVKAETGLVSDQSAQVRAHTALSTAQAITEGVRPDLIRAQTRTEQGRPPLLAAQTTNTAANTALTHRQRETEEERPDLVRQQARTTAIQGNVNFQTDRLLERYGDAEAVARILRGATGAAGSLGGLFR